MNKQLTNYFTQTKLISTSIKQNVRVHIESGLTEAEFKFRLIKLDPFIQDIINKRAGIVHRQTQITVKRDLYDQTMLATEVYNQSK